MDRSTHRWVALALMAARGWVAVQQALGPFLMTAPTMIVTGIRLQALKRISFNDDPR